MASTYIKGYLNATLGGVDGTEISQETELAPITTVPINSSYAEETGDIKLGLRVTSGYSTQGNTVITPTGTSSTNWALALDDGTGNAPGVYGAYGDALTITDEIGSTNYIIWVKANTTLGEDPKNDTSVDLNVSAVIQAV